MSHSKWYIVRYPTVDSLKRIYCNESSTITILTQVIKAYSDDVSHLNTMTNVIYFKIFMFKATIFYHDIYFCTERYCKNRKTICNQCVTIEAINLSFVSMLFFCWYPLDLSTFHIQVYGPLAMCKFDNSSSLLYKKSRAKPFRSESNHANNIL